MARTDHQVLVIFCDGQESIQDELSYTDFGLLLSGDLKLERYAATTLKSVFCVLGQGLRLKALVHFVINIDEQGQADPGFNVPLMYLAEQAGAGADLGEGAIRVASRGHCAVPWHSLNLWEAKTPDFVEQLQRRIYRNRLKLPTVVKDGIPFNPGELSLPGDLVEESDNDADFMSATGVCNEAGSRTDHSVSASTDRTAHQAFTERLESVFGTNGKLTLQDMIRLHSEQLAETKAQYRKEVEEQQSTYLTQLREVRDEMYELKIALRQERERNRRLQQMLRGDP